MLTVTPRVTLRFRKSLQLQWLKSPKPHRGRCPWTSPGAAEVSRTPLQGLFHFPPFPSLKNGFRYERKRALARSHYPDMFDTIFSFTLKGLSRNTYTFHVHVFLLLFCFITSSTLNLSNTLPYIVTYLMLTCMVTY